MLPRFAYIKQNCSSLLRKTFTIENKFIKHYITRVMMLNLTYQWLFWSRPSEVVPPPPKGLERHFITTQSGEIEILSATPSSPTSSPPILFCHGGMGSAWVWKEYMQFLSERGVPCYAVSLRGHGNSWHPSYLRMVFATTRGMLANDLVAGVKWVEKRESGRKVVIVGHSSGGGLSQGILSEGRVQVEALVLIGAVPAFGSMGVYMNWAKTDPWFVFRMILQGWHPNSPLSHPLLTKRIFFSDEIASSYLLEFQRRMSRYESFWWPITMVRPFASAVSVAEQVLGRKILVLAGTGDRLMTPDVTEKTAAFYRGAGRQLGWKSHGNDGEAEGDGVRLCFVKGAGHHVQNDVMWEDGAEKLWKFYEGVSAEAVPVKRSV